MAGCVLFGAVITPPHPGHFSGLSSGLSSRLTSGFPPQLFPPHCLQLLYLLLLHMMPTSVVCSLCYDSNPLLFLLLLPPLFLCFLLFSPFLLHLLLPPSLLSLLLPLSLYLLLPLFLLHFLLLLPFLFLSKVCLLLLPFCLLLLMPFFLHLLPLEFFCLRCHLFLLKELHLQMGNFFIHGGW